MNRCERACGGRLVLGCLPQSMVIDMIVIIVMIAVKTATYTAWVLTRPASPPGFAPACIIDMPATAERGVAGSAAPIASAGAPGRGRRRAWKKRRRKQPEIDTGFGFRGAHRPAYIA